MDRQFNWESLGDAVVFRFHGDIQSEATTDIRHSIMNILRKNHAEIAIFHMGDATYIDSMGIGMFVNLHVQHHEKVKFIFCDLSESISRSFGYVKLISFFDIRGDLDGVLKDLEFADL